MKRPDMTNVDPEIREYIESLEKLIYNQKKSHGIERAGQEILLNRDHVDEAFPPEQESNVSIITISQHGFAKRTFRHLYSRQHRGGMGILGIDISPPDLPTLLSSAEKDQTLLFFTNFARVYRHPAHIIDHAGVFGTGNKIKERIGLVEDEIIVGVLPEQAKGYIALVSKSGRLRCLRHHLFGEHMHQGTNFYNYNNFGELAAVCWTPGDADIFIATEKGIGIRFPEKTLPPQGDQGIRLIDGDKVIGVTSVYQNSEVLLIGADGRGAQRTMSGFAPNKSPGGSGKIAIRSNKVVSIAATKQNDDLFILSRLGKIIRFPSREVPASEGVVQGVNCMSLRGDEAVAMINNGPIG